MCVWNPDVRLPSNSCGQTKNHASTCYDLRREACRRPRWWNVGLRHHTETTQRSSKWKRPLTAAPKGRGGGLKHEEYAHWVVHYELVQRGQTRNKHVGRDSVIGTSQGSNPSGGEIFRTRPDGHSLLYNGYRVYFPAVKRPGRSANHSLPSRAEVRERVQLHLYSPSGPSWPVIGWTLPISFTFTNEHYCTETSLNPSQKLRENWNSGDGFLNHENAPAYYALCACGFMAENQRSTYRVSKNALHEMHRTVA